MADPQDPITASVGNPQLDTPQTDTAIDDIIAQEADEVLAAEDAIAAAQNEELLEEPSKRGHPIFWFIITLMAILALVGAYLLLHPGAAWAP